MIYKKTLQKTQSQAPAPNNAKIVSGKNLIDILTMLNVRDEPQREQHCPQVKTQALTISEARDKERKKKQILLRETQRDDVKASKRAVVIILHQTRNIKLTCRRALAVYVTMIAENVPNLRALVNTSRVQETHLYVNESHYHSIHEHEVKATKQKYTVRSEGTPLLPGDREMTHMCGGTETLGCSTRLPPPPWTWGTQCSAAWPRSHPWKSKRYGAQIYNIYIYIAV